MRNDAEKGDLKLYKIYRGKIFLPFAQKPREEFSEWRDGMPISDHLTAISWYYGSLYQISNITSVQETINLHVRFSVTVTLRIYFKLND